MPEFAGSRGKIHYGHWSPPEPKALVVFFHGLGEHIGSYEPLAEALTGAGFAVWAADHAGHGRSDGERVLIESVDDLLADAATLTDLAREAHPGLPLVIAGHSLGATVATLLVGEGRLPDRPVALVLAGSSLVPAGESGLVALLASGVDPWDLRKDPGELTRHPGYAQQIRDDPLTWQGGLRLETLRALGEAAPRVAAVLPKLDLPVLLLHGADDDLAPAAGARKVAELLPDAKAVVFPEDRHNILNELDRDDVFRVFTEFAVEHVRG
ncbi:alpha/beta fold hydrolase [Amycolatopsis kentuckyensis]|uniref:alpha/beta fold hydrolase n=1 Tax=Amycolatopsis kentuckyensis TaxID=218823 RepID=UPI00356AFEBC